MLILDQLTKALAVNYLIGSPPVDVIPGFFDFSLVYNSGAAFGLFNDAGGWQNAFFITVAVLVLVFLVVSMYRLSSADRQTAIAFALIFGGALGNVTDRALHGYVVDFIHWYYGNWHWPTFNIADSAISIGAVLLVLDIIGVRIFGPGGKSQDES